MRIIYGCAAAVLWCSACAYLIAKTGASISEDIQVLTTAIIIAGAMAGGD